MLILGNVKLLKMLKKQNFPFFKILCRDLCRWGEHAAGSDRDIGEIR